MALRSFWILLCTMLVIAPGTHAQQAPAAVERALDAEDRGDFVSALAQWERLAEALTLPAVDTYVRAAGRIAMPPAGSAPRIRDLAWWYHGEVEGVRCQ